MPLTDKEKLERVQNYLNDIREAITVIEITHRVNLDVASQEMAVNCALKCVHRAFECIDNI